MQAPVIVTWLDVGSPGDDAHTRLFFPPESNADESFRWSADYAELSIPTGRPGNYRLDLNLATVRPEGRSLAIGCGDRQHTVDLVNLGPDFTAAVACRTGTERIELTLDVPVVRLPNGGRPLGVAVRDVQVTALDSDDRRAFRIVAGVTIFGSLAGVLLAGWAASRRSLIPGLVPAAALLMGWAWFIERYPDGVLSAVSGPGGLIALIAGLTTVLLRAGRAAPAAGLALVAAATGLIWSQPEGGLVLDSRWVMEELAALTIAPWLAIIAIAAGVAVRGSRRHWLAAVGAAVAVLSLTLPAIAARNVETRLVEVNAPDWTGYGGIAGALYALAVFGLVGVAIIAAGRSDSRPVLNVAIIAAVGIAGLLLWRVQIMRFNGDEPHYYTTAWSLAEDHDLELLNNYVSERYQTIPYSPVGNTAIERDASVLRYAGGAPGVSGSWLLIPELPDGWEAPDGLAGLIEAGRQAVILTGPDGATAIPPPILPAMNHAILLEEPCRVSSLATGLPDGEAPVDLSITVLDLDGTMLWQDKATIEDQVEEIGIPAEAGLCDGSGNWTVRVDAAREIVVQAIDRHNGLQLVDGNLSQGSIFLGLPRDRYGSVGNSSRLLLHNPSDQLVQTTVRLITASDMTVSEITIGLQPGETIAETYPIFGATAVLVRVSTEVKIAATLYGVVDGARYRVPVPRAVGDYAIQIPANGTYDAGAWLTIFNPSLDPTNATVHRGEQARQIEVCGQCAVTQLEPAGSSPALVTVEGAVTVSAILYEERTGDLHYDIGLPLIAAPLALFDPSWSVLLVTALAGVLLAVGIYRLLRTAGYSRDLSLPFASIIIMLAPFSTYAVRFYTEIVAATMLTWGLLLWDRGRQSNRALAGAVLIAVAMPFLHGRLVLLAAGLLGLVLFSAIRFNHHRLARYPREVLIPAGLALVVAAGVAGLLLSQYAVALGARGIGDFFLLSWVMPNTFGMMLDRGSGVLPFAPWLIFALAAPRPLHRTQRAALVLAIMYYGLLTLRAGGWQTWGSPIRYLLPVIPLVAVLAIPGMIRLWQSGSLWSRLAVGGLLGWGALVSVLLHWLPLAGYVDRSTLDNAYLIDDALTWLPFPSPFSHMPTIEALPGPSWGEPVGIAILGLLALSAAWAGWGIVREPGSRE